MDAKRFDDWSRMRAQKVSRRDALRASSAGGLGAVFARFLPGTAHAQSGPFTCRLQLRAEIAAGPSANTSYAGDLILEIGSDGAIDQGALTLAFGTTLTVVGQATGRGINLLIEAANQSLVLTGAGEHPLSDCTGEIAGIFSGPVPGDLGTWIATPGLGSESSSGEEPSESDASGGGSSGGSGSTGPDESSGTSEPPSAPCGSKTCGPDQFLDEGTCECLCLSGSTPCGGVCCPGGTVCADPGSGACACPNGTEPCQGSCVPACPPGTLDPNSCLCVTTPECVPEGQGCADHSQCCTGYCGGGTCFTCGGRVCGDFGCIDPSIDNLNCGNCNNVCVSPQTCVGGVCQ